MEEKAKRVIKNTGVLYVRMLLLLVISLYTQRVVLENLGVSDFGLYNVVGGLITIFMFINNSMAQSSQRYITYYLEARKKEKEEEVVVEKRKENEKGDRERVKEGGIERRKENEEGEGECKKEKVEARSKEKEKGEGNKNKVKNIFTLSLLIHLSIALVITLLVESWGNWYLNNRLVIEPGREGAAAVILQVTAAITLLNIVIVPFRADIVAHERMSSFAYISLLEGGLKLGIAWAISMTTSDKLIMYGLLMLGVSLLTTSLYVGYAMRQFEEARPTLKPDFTQLREMFSFAGWSMVGSIAAAGYNQGLNLVINAFFGTTINAARGIAMHVQTVVRNFSGSFQMSVNPQITKSYAAQDREYFRKLIFKGSLYSSYLFLFFAAPVFWEVDQMLGLWLVEVPPHTAAFVRIMLLISVVEVLASPLNTGIQASGRIKRQEITIGGILLMIVPLSYLALQWVEWPEIVFAIDLGCVMLAHAMRMYNARILCGLSIRGYIRQVLGRLAMVQACASLLPLMLWWQLEGTLINGIIVCVAAVASNLTVIYVLGLEREERATIIRYIENKLHR